MSLAAEQFREHRPGWILALLVFLLYASLSVLRHSDHLIWDEGRYLGYAENLTQGFYVSDADPDFVNGPGYPVVLMPFHSGPEMQRLARVLNAFFMAGAVLFVWFTVKAYAGRGWALGVAALTGLHPTLIWMGFALMTEPLSMFCVCGFVWAFCRALRGAGWAGLVVAGLFLGWLILTRVFFGHVLTATTFVTLGLLLVCKPWRPVLRRALLVWAVAGAMCVPYLAYTQKKTGQVLCWSTNSGELLYWMTSHHDGENGHWFSTEDAQAHPDVAPLHDAFYEAVLKKPVLEREAIFKEAAKANLKANPRQVFYNWVCNLSRLAFGFPRSHQPEELRTVVLIFTNGPLILFAAGMGLLGLWRWRGLPAEIWLLVVFAAFYLGGSTLAPALPRYFVLMVPALGLASAAMWSRHVRLTLTPP